MRWISKPNIEHLRFPIHFLSLGCLGVVIGFVGYLLPKGRFADLLTVLGVVLVAVAVVLGYIKKKPPNDSV